MSLEDFMDNAMSEWMKSKGQDSDIVFSSRVRIARNLSGYPFPMLNTSSKAEEVVNLVKKALEVDAPPFLDGSELILMKDLSELEKRVLVEKHLISPILAEKSVCGAVLLNKEESISIMINEEDHIRIQCLFPGLQLKEAWELANQIDDWLESNLPYSFNEELGFLTSCPTNVGTGIRASVMVHMPALSITKQLNKLFQAVTQVGLAVRGIYGEGSETLGQLYQVSNQVTLGQSEDEILDNLIDVVKQIIEHEHVARKNLQEESIINLEDRVFRSFGILSNCRTIDSKESMSKLSDVRLGIDLGLIDYVDSNVMNELMVMTQPGFLQKYANEMLDSEQRDIRRALLIRERLTMERG